ncbi:TlpA family protein disulfide reductase [Flavobacterium sp.]|uniref:TlpA family protein disulfide reductase n=1 Tax=Flavobacterium sp. TaxID=239 RepID=UPI003750056A
MKKILKIIILIVVLSILAFMGYKVVTKIRQKKEVAEHIKIIPVFEYQTLEGKPFSNKDLKENTATVFLYFNSECEHCQSEATQIKEKINQFKNVQLVFISFEEPKQIATFAITYKLNNDANIYFLCDSKVSFATTFDVKSLPTIVVYDKEKNLLKKIKGQVKVQTILKLLNKA